MPIAFLRLRDLKTNPGLESKQLRLTFVSGNYRVSEHLRIIISYPMI